MRTVLAAAALAAAFEGGAALAAGPEGGAVRALAVDRATGAVLAGTQGGVFRSEDRGLTWSGASEGLTSLDVTALAVTDARAFWAAAGGSLYRSRDGRTWAKEGSGLNGSRIGCLLPDPAKSDALYAAVADRGLFHGDDQAFRRVAMDRTSVFALAAEAASGRVYAGTGDGVFASSDGKSWDRAGSLEGPVAALLSAGAPGVLFAAVAGRGVLRSGDGGHHWIATALANTAVFALALGSNSIYAASLDGVFASPDAGATWALTRFAPVTALATGNEEGSLLYAASSAGVWRRQKGAPWKLSMTGLNASNARAVILEAGGRGRLWAGTERGLFESLDSGKTWSAVSVGAELGSVSALALTDRERRELLVGSDGALARSLSGGESWSTLPTAAVFGIAVDPNNPRTVYAGTRGRVIKSTDGGIGWQEVNLGKSFALGLAVDPANPAVIYAATAGEGVWRSADAAKSWKAFGSELAHTVVRCVAVAREGTVYAGADGGVFRSLTTGKGWSPSGAGMPRTSVYALAVDPTDPKVVYAGTSEGLYRTADAGDTWTQVPGIPRVTVAAIALDAASGRIAVGTLGAGVIVLPASSQR